MVIRATRRSSCRLYLFLRCSNCLSIGSAPGIRYPTCKHRKVIKNNNRSKQKQKTPCTAKTFMKTEIENNKVLSPRTLKIHPGHDPQIFFWEGGNSTFFPFEPIPDNFFCVRWMRCSQRLPKISDDFPWSSERCRKCLKMFPRPLSRSDGILKEQFFRRTQSQQ